MSVKNLTSLMESTCYVCTKQQNVEHMKLALSDICGIPLSFMQSMSFEDIGSIDKDQLLKALSMIEGVIKALLDLEEAMLEQTLLPMIQSVWDKILGILRSRFNDKELITACCSLIQRALKAVGYKLLSYEFFENLSSHLILCFKSNASNITCLSTFSELCGEMGKANDQIKQCALQKQLELSEFTLQLVNTQ
jgi:hypothetical protein